MTCSGIEALSRSESMPRSIFRALRAVADVDLGGLV